MYYFVSHLFLQEGGLLKDPTWALIDFKIGTHSKSGKMLMSKDVKSGVSVAMLI